MLFNVPELAVKIFRSNGKESAVVSYVVVREDARACAEVGAMDVPLCMIAVKLARQAHRHKRDNLVDIAGYARTAAMVAGDE